MGSFFHRLVRFQLLCGHRMCCTLTAVWNAETAAALVVLAPAAEVAAAKAAGTVLEVAEGEAEAEAGTAPEVAKREEEEHSAALQYSCSIAVAAADTATEDFAVAEAACYGGWEVAMIGLRVSQ